MNAGPALMELISYVGRQTVDRFHGGMKKNSMLLEQNTVDMVVRECFCVEVIVSLTPT